MSDILCRWLNQELRLSKAVEPKTFAKDFSSGYLIGEVLHKYQLQNDFSMFMKKDTSISKLNNFTRLEPTLQLLGISFDINTVQELMQEKQGVATRLLYQLYISLEKKKRTEISGTMMEIMQPAANAGLHKKEHGIYSDRLHQVVKRDAELKLQKISEHYEEKCQQLSERSVMTYPIQQKMQLKVQDEKRMKNIEKLQMYRQKYNGIMPCNQANIVQVPKPPPYTSQLNLRKRQQQQQRRKHQAQVVQIEIAQFETNRKKLVTSSFASSSSGSGQPIPGDLSLDVSSQGCEVPGSGTKLILQSSSKYIQELRQRIAENAVAREQREKRRDRFLVEQLKAHEAQEEAQREEQLVKRLTRQTQQELRLASQLLQMRMQKEVIRENRLFREQQYQQRREKDFQEALEREAALAQQAKLDRTEEIKKELEFFNRIAAERAQSRYKKHFNSCKDIVEQIVDLATKVGEYRLLTANLIPEKLMREWKELLFRGLPLYEPVKGQQAGFEFSTPLDPVELKKQEILNNQDYDEYTSMVGEWVWPEEAGETKLAPTNNILGHVVLRLRNIVHPPIMEPSAPSFPQFTLKACVLGKFCSGKTTCLAKIAEAYGICVLSADTLIEEALNAYHSGEQNLQVTEQQGEKDNEQLLTSSTSPKSDLDTEEESGDIDIRLSTRAMLGAAAEKDLREGNAIPNEVLVDIIVEAIRQVPAQSGWILDGFPVDITQAYLLEKALGGSVDVGNEVESSRANLAADPDPPKPLPPPNPVLDLALLLDIPDETVMKHAFNHTDADTAAETTSHHTDKNLYLAQIPHRITAFQDTWPKLELWYGEKQNILVRVDASEVEEEVYKRVESVLLQVLMQTQEALAAPPFEDVLDSGKAQESSASATPLPVDQPPSLTDEAPGPTDSHSRLNDEKAQSVNSLSKSNTHSPTGHSRKASTSSVTNEVSQGVSKILPETASPCPGSSSWVYVDEPLPVEIAEYLCPHWDTVCDSYVNNIKTVMQQLRSQSTVISHHLFNIREEFKHYLGRPDLKQELVSQWQKDFNSIPDDMREDEDTKAELHLRLDELRERLWDISDKRKEQDEQERASLMCDGWLEDHTAVLINHHATLTQVELDRFQETVCILRVYYLSMYRQVLPEPPSNFVCIPLMETSEIKDQGESVPLLPRRPDSSGGVSKTKGQDQTEPLKPPHEKLISDYEEALRAIVKLVSAEARQGATKEQKEKPQEKEREKTTASSNKTKKGKQSAKKQKGPPSPSPPPSPAPADDKNSEKTHDQEVRNKIHKEYAAALDHEENAAKVRIALVKGHGLVMVQSLQSRAEQAFSDMEKWLEAHYLAEVKSIDQLSEVVRHHIEAAAKLQNELVLECTDFYLNGDCRMVATRTPSAHPPPLEKPTQSTPTITQLESLHQQLCNVAPSGLIPSSDFSSLLRDITAVNMGRNILPEPWVNTNETQLMEIVALLVDDYELVDWRQFLLSAALPWSFPSLTQLLAVLKRFRAADTGNTGYINREQYLQTELWFSSESVQPVSEDPSEPLPYDRLANLRKFFFQLFADHSFSPPRLDYVSMLQYFAADPNPRQGFIRALSVVLGQHLKHFSPGHLVRSMPIIEEATELSSSELDGECKEEETSCPSSSSLVGQEVSIPALLEVICHKITKMKDGNPLPPGCLSQEEHTEHLVHVFRELGYKPENGVPFFILSQHPFIQGLMETTTHYQLVNIHRVLLANQGEVEANSSTVS
ncbi:sperm flagellar protein 2-like [Seriola lalandi dorsalis]|uniref:sperm flagellar protein 2-like n=1 Tax=Seriola lalandi dorsalis TaxID=1841481 RepID=UPI000C6FC7EF|nr:sperm flagellar protein 2-like [Seriola lalandi dorsalis]